MSRRFEIEDEHPHPQTITRREVLLRGAAATATLSLGACEAPADVHADAGTDAGECAPFTDHPGVFRHGVASGDPMTDRVILWTRISEQTADTEARYEVSRTPNFDVLVAQGTAIALATRDYTIKVDAAGLEPGTTYYYRFSAAGATSPVGRTRTAPMDGTRLRFAVASCASFGHGYFHAYRHMAQRADLDAVIFLGDYIYEGGNTPNCVAWYGGVRPQDPPYEILTLSDYRRRYSRYRQDPDLQEVHRQHPFIATWDDHEIANNAWRDGAQNHMPDEGLYADRKAAASRAYLEWLPIREQADGHIYRSLTYGTLAELIVLDTRHEGRDNQPTRESDPQPADCNCLPRQSPDRRIVSAEQLNFLETRLRTSNAHFKIVCQQVMMSSLQPVASILDAWDGYPADRNRVLAALRQYGGENPIVLTGDVHSSWVFDLTENALDSATYDRRRPQRGSLGVELVTPAVTSFSAFSAVPDDMLQMYADMVPNLQYTQVRDRGYLVLDLERSGAEATYWYQSDIRERVSQGEHRGGPAVWIAPASKQCELRGEVTKPAPSNPPALAP